MAVKGDVSKRADAEGLVGAAVDAQALGLVDQGGVVVGPELDEDGGDPQPPRHLDQPQAAPFS